MDEQEQVAPPGMFRFHLRSKDIWGRQDERSYIGQKLAEPPCELGPGELVITSDRPEVIPFRVIKRAHLVRLERILTMKLDRRSVPVPRGEPVSNPARTAGSATSMVSAAATSAPALRKWRVPNSKGDGTYYVTWSG